MSNYDKNNKNDEYYTPKEVFDVLGCEFDLDVAAPRDLTHIKVPAKRFIHEDSLNVNWDGFVWMNPPYSGKGSKSLWLNKLYSHGNGIALLPDRTSAPWWPEAVKKCDSFLLTHEKIKFVKPDGSIAKQPGTGNTFFAYGKKADEILIEAEKKGFGIRLKYNN